MVLCSNMLSSGVAYGSVSQPTALGSGGSTTAYTTGGRGGSALRLAVVGTVSVTGTITVDGTNGKQTFYIRNSFVSLVSLKIN